MAIYISSDLHLCHDREFVWKPRGFDNVTQMNDAIVQRFNEILTPNDTLYLLGDCMLNDNALGSWYLNQIKGNIKIILGNHDTSARVKLYESNPKIEVLGYGYPLKFKKYNFYLSHYPTLTANDDYKDALYKKVLNLCGHTHTQEAWSDLDKGMIYHVEVDAHDCRPVLLDDILDSFKEKFDTV